MLDYKKIERERSGFCRQSKKKIEDLLEEKGVRTLYELFGYDPLTDEFQKRVYWIRDDRKEKLDHVAKLLCQDQYLYDGARRYGDKTVLRFTGKDSPGRIYIAAAEEEYLVWYQNADLDAGSFLSDYLGSDEWYFGKKRPYDPLARSVLEQEDLNVFLEYPSLFYACERWDMNNLPCYLRIALGVGRYRQNKVAYGENGEVIAAGFVNLDANELPRSYLYQVYHNFEDDPERDEIPRVENICRMFPQNEIVTDEGKKITLRALACQNRPLSDCFVLPQEIFCLDASEWESDINYRNLCGMFSELRDQGYEYRSETVQAGVDAYYNSLNYEIRRLPVCEELGGYRIIEIEMEFVNPKTNEAKYINIRHGGMEMLVYVPPVFDKMVKKPGPIPTMLYQKEGTPEPVALYYLILPVPVFQKTLEEYGLIKDTVLWDVFSNLMYVGYSDIEYSRDFMRIKKIKEVDILTKLWETLGDCGYSLCVDCEFADTMCFANDKRDRAVFITEKGNAYEVRYLDRYMTIDETLYWKKS